MRASVQRLGWIVVWLALWSVGCLDSKRREPDAGGSGGDGGSAGTAGSGGDGGSAGSAGTAGTSGSGGDGGSAGTSGSGGDGGCAGTGMCPGGCSEGRDCCADGCVNLNNDPRHCGACDNVCEGSTSFCSGGTCGEPPCSATCSDAPCCGTTCCAPGQICCDVEGPVSGIVSCVDPVNGTCPQGCAPLCVCNAPDTPIATVDGERPIAELRVGDLVYSVDRNALTLVPILRINRVPALNHHVMHIVLDNGATLDISPVHPLTDGRRIGDLRVGDSIDNATVLHAELIAYAHDATYDILPASDTGFYIAGGVTLASTLGNEAR